MVDENASLATLLAQRHAEIPLYLVTLRPSGRVEHDTDSVEGRELFRQHLIYWWRLESQGHLVAAGPAARATGDAHGVAVLTAASIDAARRLAENEPFHRAGWRTNSVIDWQLNEGLLVAHLRGGLEQVPTAGH